MTKVTKLINKYEKLNNQIEQIESNTSNMVRGSYAELKPKAQKQVDKLYKKMESISEQINTVDGGSEQAYNHFNGSWIS